MNILTNLLWTLHFLTMAYKVKGFADGDLTGSCDSMLVHHESRGVMFPPQTDPMPFEVEPVITGPNLITVTLRGKDATFKGFMLEARHKHTDSIVGKFLILEPERTRLLNCNGLLDSAVSQKTNNDKKEVRVSWTSETEDLDVIFRATVVQQFRTFWNPVDFPISLKPSTTPATTTPTTLATTPSTTESTTEPPDTTVSVTPTTKLSTTKHSATSISTTTITASVSSTTKQHFRYIDGYVPGVTFSVIVAAPVTLIPFCHPQNAKNHIIRKWVRRVGSILCFALILSALIVLGIFDEPINLELLALGIVMSVTGIVTLVLAFIDIGRSHELWTRYDNVMKVLFLIQKAFAIAFIYCATKHCQGWLLKVLIAFTLWIFLQIAYIIIVKILKFTGSGNKKGIERMQESKMSVAAVIITSFLNIAFCVAIIIGICQC